MLVVTRRTGERLMVDRDIEIRVLSAKAGRVRLGIVAPDDVTVERMPARDRTRPALTGEED